MLDALRNLLEINLLMRKVSFLLTFELTPQIKQGMDHCPSMLRTTITDPYSLGHNFIMNAIHLITYSPTYGRGNHFNRRLGLHITAIFVILYFVFYISFFSFTQQLPCLN